MINVFSIALRKGPLLNAAVLLALFLSPKVHASDVPELLVRIISIENKEMRAASLEDGSYRGEEGILNLRPEVGMELGLVVHVDRGYEEALELYDNADKSLDKAKRAMAARLKEKAPGDHVRTILETILEHRAWTKKARDLLEAYAANLDSSVDERLDDTKCEALMVSLLSKCLAENGNRLRDALGCFYNTCRGVEASSCLTPENVLFVNSVFKGFVENAKLRVLAKFDLDRMDRERAGPADWKKAAGSKEAKIVPHVETALKRLDLDGVNPVDPLLFLALMRRESRFDHRAISHVGAAGLTQIMPKTAQNMGMQNIFRPDYFDRAFLILKKEREARRAAMDALFAIASPSDHDLALEARAHMQASLRLREERKKLFKKYYKELQGNTTDPRLNPGKAVEYGLRYFSNLMKKQNGDISLALASYNAGPHRVTQYNGIPPYGETVRFRNTVLEFYREYLERLKGS